MLNKVNKNHPLKLKKNKNTPLKLLKLLKELKNKLKKKPKNKI